jgi:uncharacterized protein (DUF2252 family)
MLLKANASRNSSHAAPSVPEKPAAQQPATAPGAASALPSELRVVVAGADREIERPLRRRPLSSAQRWSVGRSLRQRVPRKWLGQWKAPATRPDPIAQIRRSQQGRQEWLIPIQVGRMAASPYGFLRGAAVVMTEDLAHLPATGIMLVACGDAHLGNFGFYASPEQDLVIDLNDFDEAHPGAWEWDLRRLVTSIWVAGRQNSCRETQCETAVASCVAAYRQVMRFLAEAPLLSRSYRRVDVDRLRETVRSKSLRQAIVRAAKRSRNRTSDRALPRFTTPRGRRIVSEPPLITRVSKSSATRIAAGLDAYLMTLAPHWRRALGNYTLLDIAHKVVGVSSVGLRSYIALLQGGTADDVIFLQLKQARRSVLAPYVHGPSAWHAHQGQRVVEYQQALQTISDPLLGWTTIEGIQYYVRQFRNMKGGVPLDAMDAAALSDYAAIVGHLLAKGHARTGRASAIAGYVGGSGKLDRALCRFARAYADQTEADHELLVKAVARGVLPAEYGI